MFSGLLWVLKTSSNVLNSVVMPQSLGILYSFILDLIWIYLPAERNENFTPASSLKSPGVAPV